MNIQPCPKCGGKSFTGTVVVTFMFVPIEITEDDEHNEDWFEGQGIESEIIRASCDECGTEQGAPHA